MVGFKSLSAVAAIAGLVSAHPGHMNQKRALPVGQIITSCKNTNVVALTFDDGPAQYTEQLLDTLKASKAGHKATFFVNGDNYGYIYNYNSTIRRMISDGHQIGSHTWGHVDITSITEQGLIEQMTKVEDALDNILGFHSKYMRPPFLATNAASLNTLKNLRYHVINIDIDTLDWANNELTPLVARQNYENGYNAGGRLSLAHDPEEVTVKSLVPWIIEFLASKNMKSVTVGECLGEDPSTFYERKVGGVSSALPSSTAAASSSKASSSIKASSSVYSSSIKASSSVYSSSVKASSSVYSSSAKPSSSAYPSSSKASVPASAYSSSVKPSSAPASVSAKSSVSASASVSAASVSAKGSPKGSAKAPGSSSLSGFAKSSVSAISASAKSSVSAVSASAKAPGSSAKASVPPKSAAPSSAKASVPAPSSAKASAKPSVGPVHESGRCGVNNGGYACDDDECCSPYGWCGKSKAYCGNGCQSAFGTCDAQDSDDEGSGPITQDGTCGGDKGTVCASGECCSQWGWCGTSDDHCKNQQWDYSGY